MNLTISENSGGENESYIFSNGWLLYMFVHVELLLGIVVGVATAATATVARALQSALEKYTSRDHIHLHRFKKGKEEKRFPLKETHEYNARRQYRRPSCTLLLSTQSILIIQ